MRRLGDENVEVVSASRDALDLRCADHVRSFAQTHRPDVVFLAAAKVGGISANQADPVGFLHDNLLIAANVMAAAHAVGTSRLLYVASSAVYSPLARQPMREGEVPTGPLEPTHEGYAVAKIAGLTLAKAYRAQYGLDYFSVLPTNLYGTTGNIDLQTSHVIPALIRKAHEAKVAGEDHITIWGAGTACREFLHADDCAAACVHLMDATIEYDLYNLGSDEEVTILELTKLVCEAVGFNGEIRTDPSKPEGPARKRLDSGRLRATGWMPRVSLRDGLKAAYASFLEKGRVGV